MSEQPSEGSTEPESESSTGNEKPTVIGIYGISGSGKSYLLSQLRRDLDPSKFTCYEGSELISVTCSGGLVAFQKLSEAEKVLVRQAAIDKVRHDHEGTAKAAVVTGHYMFWNEGEEGQVVCTANDLNTFTRILYLDVPAPIIMTRRKDVTRARASMSIEHLNKWKDKEKLELRQLCYEHGILFSLAPRLIRDPKWWVSHLYGTAEYTESINSILAEAKVDQALREINGSLKTMLVLDADRTLTEQETGQMFWAEADIDSPLGSVFNTMGYSFAAFRQAALLYEEMFDGKTFQAICDRVALTVNMYPDMVSLLNLVVSQKSVGAIVVTCGLQRVWEKVLLREGLSEKIQVIGLPSLASKFVVTPTLKAEIVKHLKVNWHVTVWAFGDSAIDIPMLQAADHAVVVVGEQNTRSQMMDTALGVAIKDGLHARQVLIPSSVPPRLDTTRLPLMQLTEFSFVQKLLRDGFDSHQLKVIDTTGENSTKLLMTPMRDSTVSGPALREIHHNVGWYLATKHLTDVIGLEEYSIRHVQGSNVNGYRLLHEKQTLIVAMMRGGEPLALGVNEAFPTAMFLHATLPEDIRQEHLKDKLTVILVDSVINTGESVVELVMHINMLHPFVQIVIVSGVTQSRSIDRLDELQRFIQYNRLSLVTLRVSDNKFKGKGATDTGNRLFNTTHLG